MPTVELRRRINGRALELESKATAPEHGSRVSANRHCQNPVDASLLL
jgi:hypothetical protein